MFELPMLIFKMTGEKSLIELTMDEVFGYPESTDVAGGYSAKGILTIRSGSYSVSDIHYFATGELYDFMNDLQRAYDCLSGEVVLRNFERELDLTCAFDKIGHVFVKGRFQAIPSVDNILEFELKTDQTQVCEAIGQLKKVVKIFGDNKGKKGRKTE